MNDDDWEDEGEPEAGTAILDSSRLVLPGSKDKAYVIVLRGGATGTMQKVDGELVLGRSEKAHLRVLDDGVSRRHARIFIENNVMFIEDLGSTNGTLVNGVLIAKPARLQDGDKIQIGATCLLKFSFQDDFEESFQQEMYRAALCDALTGAYNKKALLDRLDTEMAFSVRHGTPLSLLIFDLD